MQRSTQQLAKRRRRNGATKRRGTIIVLSALVMIGMMGVMALSIDTGYMYTMQTQLDRAVDSAALAGAGSLVDGTAEAEEMALEYLLRNPVGPQVITVDNRNLELLKQQFLDAHGEELEIAMGHWNSSTGQLEVSTELPSAISVTYTYPNNPLFFARALGHSTFTLQSEAVAMYQPRDIMVVLDFSGSMNDDSELSSVGTLGHSAVVDNLEQIYEELGSPVFGNMQFTPVYISSNYTSTIKNLLGLNGVPYPYPSGSWNDYIRYVKSDSSVRNAGYRKKYGYLTLVNYWIDRRDSYSETPDLWKGSAQPVTAVKNAVDVFMDYIQTVDTDDRVGLAIYNASNGNGIKEHSLTNDFAAIVDTVRHRQAGHYHSYTNIGAGMQVAREELQQNGRQGAFKMIVLMTDGQANWVNGGYSTSGAQNYVLGEAAAAADVNYPIVTISLGSGADTGLMQQVADITESLHFNVPGGQQVSDYSDDLIDVFRTIADNRPLKIVK